MPEKIGFMRLSDVLVVLPVSRTTWYDGIRAGKYPPPVKMGRASMWKKLDIINLVEKIANGGQGNAEKAA